MKSLSLAITLCGLFAFILLAISPVTALPKAYQAVITDNIAHANSITTPEQQVVDIARAPSAVITSVEVQSYTRDYDVTVEEAIRRFELLRLVSALNEQLGKNERTSFGGLWVQHVPEFKVFINLTSGGNQLVQRYTENGPLEGRIQVVEVQRTLDELVLTARSMYDRVSELEVPFDYDISIPRNRVEVYLPHSSLGARRSQFEIK